SGMLAKLLPQSLENAMWAFSPSAFPQVLQLLDGTNRATTLPATAREWEGGPRQWTIAGLPARCTDKLPALGTKGDLVLIDPRFFIIGDHGEEPGGTVEISVSAHAKFLQHQYAIRVLRRTDGQPALDKPVTLADGS